jgi:hypothetical protein
LTGRFPTTERDGALGRTRRACSVRPVRQRCAEVPAVLALVLLGACVGGGDEPSLSMDQLDGTGRTCPVDLDNAVAAAGLGEPDADVHVEVERGSGEGDPRAGALAGETPIEQVGGVYVECTLPVGDGHREGDGGDGDAREISSYLLATEQPRAINLLLPLIQRDLELGVDDLNGISDRFAATDEGEIVDLGADGPAAAARIEVDDADSAVLYVSATGGATSPAQVRTVAENLLDEL